MKTSMLIGCCTAIAISGAAFVSDARAEPAVEAFYRGKQIQLVVGFGVGDGFDLYARILSRHISRHIPGRPSIVVQNMPGVGSLRALNYLLTVAPKDGTAFGLVNPTATVDPIFYPQQANFDPRTLNWIGSMSSDTTTCGFWTRDLVTIETLRSRQFVVGGTAVTSGTMRANKVLSSLLGLNFRLVSGYRTLGDLNMAAEQGEIQGYCGVMVSTVRAMHWARFLDGGLQIAVQAGLERDPDLPASIPNAFDLLQSAGDRQLLQLFAGPWHYGRPFVASPGLPRERLDALRAAFDAMHRDPEFLQEAGRMKLRMRSLTGSQVADAIKAIYDTPKEVIERARPIMGSAP